jgi:hypothetical protein
MHAGTFRAERDGTWRKQFLERLVSRDTLSTYGDLERQAPKLEVSTAHVP